MLWVDRSPRSFPNAVYDISSTKSLQVTYLAPFHSYFLPPCDSGSLRLGLTEIHWETLAIQTVKHFNESFNQPQAKQTAHPPCCADHPSPCNHNDTSITIRLVILLFCLLSTTTRVSRTVPARKCLLLRHFASCRAAAGGDHHFQPGQRLRGFCPIYRTGSTSLGFPANS